MNKLLTLGLTLCTVVSASAQVVHIDVDYIDNMGKFQLTRIAFMQ